MKKSVHDEKKSDLIAGLRNVRERILALASSMQQSQRDEVYVGTWALKEMLAHLAGWDETNIAAVGEVLAGELPSFYDHSGKDWAGYNAKLVTEYSKDNYEDLLLLVRNTHSKLITLIEDLPVGELWKDRGIRAKGWKVTIGRLLEAELQDEEEHFSQLKHFVQDGVKS